MKKGGLFTLLLIIVAVILIVSQCEDKSEKELFQAFREWSDATMNQNYEKLIQYTSVGGEIFEITQKLPPAWRTGNDISFRFENLIILSHEKYVSAQVQCTMKRIEQGLEMGKANILVHAEYHTGNWRLKRITVVPVIN